MWKINTLSFLYYLIPYDFMVVEESDDDSWKKKLKVKVTFKDILSSNSNSNKIEKRFQNWKLRFQ